MTHSKTTLFLMELIISLLFFSLASTVCVQLFVKSRNLSRQTTELNYGVTAAQNLAEAFYGCQGELDAVQALFEGSSLSQDGRTLTVSEDSYCATLSLAGAGQDCLEADIRTFLREDPQRDIYSLHILFYPGERGDENGRP